jgi:hypothetical protein
MTFRQQTPSSNLSAKAFVSNTLDGGSRHLENRKLAITVSVSALFMQFYTHMRINHLCANRKVLFFVSRLLILVKKTANLIVIKLCCLKL